ncbi:MAG: GTP-binding protein Era [Candidatus Gottesmanbacteria bacterium GW2011_GWC2_39_8]|uniref:GTP-binding protein Era n=1 Tax=Candidatus Gottesmanbacteria bacterium GW2011_GWC2_39_8 TaxID=1618450 RepID=A0A0G0S9R1_9BACT|nr:MAG: GTP-binding protein Era [Candidatus Gottesmanbacteria bacterium GW2011_GWC2_39_8]
MYSEVKERIAILVIDAKVGITDFDADMIKTLNEYHVNHIIVANKIDNLKMGEKDRQLKDIQEQYPASEIIPNSSMKRKHEDKLMRRIEFYLPH